MNYKSKKTIIRDTVRQAIRLQKENLIDEDVLQIIAASALAWEITTKFDEKFSKKFKKLEDQIYYEYR